MKVIKRWQYDVIFALIFVILFNILGYTQVETNPPIKKIEVKEKPIIQEIQWQEDKKEIFAQGNEIKRIIWDNAVKQNLDLNYLLGICLIETAGTLNPKLIGPQTYCGRASGIMQLMPELIKIYNIEDPLNPEENIKAGSTHLKWLIDYYKNKKIYDENENLLKTEYVAAMAYNWGQNNIDRMLKKYDCIIIENLPYEVRRYFKIIKAHCNGDTELVKKLLN